MADTQMDEEIQRLRVLGVEFGMTLLEIVPPEALSSELVADLSVDWARTHCLLPVLLDGVACVLTADPGHVSAMEYLALLAGRELRPVLAPRGEILRGIEACYFNREASPDAFVKTLDPGAETLPRVRQSSDLLTGSPDAPVSQFVNLVLLEAVKRRASDIHFEPLEDRLRVRYRIDGILFEQSSPPRNLEDAIISRIKVMANMDIAEKRLPQDGMARVRVGERELDIRAATIPVPDGERVVLRLLDKQSALIGLGELGMLPETLGTFRRLLTSVSGMVLVCGPTGSGKTTTLYAALAELDSRRRNILTIEDPIEYKLPNIGQIQVKPRIGLTFANGLRHILRQDPDVILVGEIRDAETAEIAIRAALTGHLVFATLHTNDAPGAVLRLTDMGVEPYLLASCLRGAISQRLVRRLCPRCRREARLSERLASGLARAGERPLAGLACWEPAGCDACLEGYKGRLGIFEMMPVDAAMAELIHAGQATEALLRRLATEHGMQSLRDDGIAKLLAGLTSPEEICGAVAAP